MTSNFGEIQIYQNEDGKVWISHSQEDDDEYQ